MLTLRRLASGALLAILPAALLFSQTANTDSTRPNAAAGKVQPVPGLPAAVQQAMTTVDAQRIRAHVKFLASDLLEGRGTGQRGGDIAAEYIATQFAL
jgi:hypothetical protein